MKTLFSLLLIVCTSIPVSAQWNEQISGTTAYLFSVDFVNNDIGWVAGSSGVIKGTTNGGQTWTDTGTTHAFGQCTYNDICFPTLEMGYACGYIRVNDFNMRNWATTENGGDSWSWPTSWGFPPRVFRDVFFVNDSIGWRVDSGGEVAKIVAGVDGFSISTGAHLDNSLYAIHFINENMGWVVGRDGYIAKSADGGNNWIALVSGITDQLQSVFFINSNTGWAVGDKDDIGVIIKTIDGGDTWYTVNYPPTFSMHQIQFVNENTGWACGSKLVDSEERGVILYTGDGGENWSEQYVCNRLSKLYSLIFIDELSGWAVGYDGIILKTSNAGGTAAGVDNKGLDNYSLSDNYPNPFVSETIIRYSIPKKEKVELKVYDFSGREIALLVDEEKTPGTYELVFNASLLSRGIYYYKISAGDFRQTKKMVLLKK